MIIVIPLVALTIGLIVGVVTLRNQMVVLFWVLAAALVGFGAWMFVLGRAASNGWDGIGYAIAMTLMAAPCLLGLLIGGLIAYLRRRKAQKEGDDGAAT